MGEEINKGKMMGDYEKREDEENKMRDREKNYLGLWCKGVVFVMDRLEKWGKDFGCLNFMSREVFSCFLVKGVNGSRICVVRLKNKRKSGRRRLITG